MPRRRNRNPKKEKGYATMADCVFPEEIMTLILTRLPVKSIIRFKSVCVPWRVLFSTSRFIKMHQDHFTKKQSVIIHSLDVDKPFQKYHYYQYFGLPLPPESVSIFEIESNEMKSTTLPECYQWRDFVGCCNGLVCIGLPILGPQSIVLWNPATSMFKVIGLWEDVPRDREAEKVSLGFGYNDERADFKVVRISCLTNYGLLHNLHRIEISMSVVGVEVYSVNSDSWTTITPNFQFTLSLEKKNNNAIVNGNPYWVAEVEGNESARNLCGEVLVRFDVKRLVFEIVPLSELNFNLVGMEVLPLVDWNGSLAFLEQTDESFVVVWVFDEGEQIWRENTILGPIENMNGDFTLQCSRDGKIMGHITDGKLFVFDQNNGFIKNVKVPQATHFEVFPYTESLTHIDGMVLWRGGLGDYAWQECEI